MERANAIIKHDEYKKHLEEITRLEEQRIYCHHDMNHFLDVARIGMILAHEENINVPKGYIYAAALLHDIGRDEQYINGTAHEIASAVIADRILTNLCYNDEERKIIIEAIREHGNEESLHRHDFVGIIYRADKLSRKCFACGSEDTCHKAVEKRNMVIKY